MKQKVLAYLSFLKGQTNPSHSPAIYVIETTNYCNLDCFMCPRQDMTRPKGNMDFKTFKKIIDESAKTTSFVWLHLMGEPLLDKNIFKYVRYCHSKGIKAGFSTNATLLSKNLGKKIIKSGLNHLVISMDGFTQYTYEKIRKPANFYTVKNNIIAFLNLKDKNKPPYTVIQIIKMNETKEEIDAFKLEWGCSNANEVYVKDFCTWAGQLNKKNSIVINKDKYNRGSNAKRPPCFFLWWGLSILQDGTVISCCRDFNGSMVLGNINVQSLKEIWTSKKMQKLRKQQLTGKFCGVCKNCTDWPPVYRTPNKETIKLMIKKALDFRRKMD